MASVGRRKKMKGLSPKPTGVDTFAKCRSKSSGMASSWFIKVNLTGCWTFLQRKDSATDRRASQVPMKALESWGIVLVRLSKIFW